MIMFWVMPLFVIGGAVLLWRQLRSGEGASVLGQTLVLLHPIGVVARIVGLVQYRRAKACGESSMPGRYKPRRRL